MADLSLVTAATPALAPPTGLSSAVASDAIGTDPFAALLASLAPPAEEVATTAVATPLVPVGIASAVVARPATSPVAPRSGDEPVSEEAPPSDDEAPAEDDGDPGDAQDPQLAALLAMAPPSLAIAPPSVTSGSTPPCGGDGEPPAAPRPGPAATTGIRARVPTIRTLAAPPPTAPGTAAVTPPEGAGAAASPHAPADPVGGEAALPRRFTALLMQSTAVAAPAIGAAVPTAGPTTGPVSPTATVTGRAVPTSDATAAPAPAAGMTAPMRGAPATSAAPVTSDAAVTSGAPGPNPDTGARHAPAGGDAAPPAPSPFRMTAVPGDGGPPLARPIAAAPATPAVAGARATDIGVPSVAAPMTAVARGEAPAGRPVDRARARVEVSDRAADLSQPPSAQAPQAAVPVSQGPDLPQVGAATAPAPSALDGTMTRALSIAQDDRWLNSLTRDIAATAGRDGQLSFRLDPLNLGHLTIHITHSDEGASIRMSADTEAARTILADAQPRLAAEARAQGLTLRETSVDLGGSGANGGQQRAADTFAGLAQGQSQQRESARDHRIINLDAVERDDTAAAARPRERSDLYA